jgi:hypothetical protein
MGELPAGQLGQLEMEFVWMRLVIATVPDLPRIREPNPVIGRRSMSKSQASSLFLGCAVQTDRLITEPSVLLFSQPAEDLAFRMAAWNQLNWPLQAMPHTSPSQCKTSRFDHKRALAQVTSILNSSNAMEFMPTDLFWQFRTKKGKAKSVQSQGPSASRNLPKRQRGGRNDMGSKFSQNARRCAKCRISVGVSSTSPADII